MVKVVTVTAEVGSPTLRSHGRPIMGRLDSLSHHFCGNPALRFTETVGFNFSARDVRSRWRSNPSARIESFGRGAAATEAAQTVPGNRSRHADGATVGALCGQRCGRIDRRRARTGARVARTIMHDVQPRLQACRGALSRSDEGQGEGHLGCRAVFGHRAEAVSRRVEDLDRHCGAHLPTLVDDAVQLIAVEAASLGKLRLAAELLDEVVELHSPQVAT
jgi:hypothetical protein